MALRWLKAVVAALSLVLAVAAARADDFTDAAGRHVRLPDQIGRILPAVGLTLLSRTDPPASWEGEHA